MIKKLVLKLNEEKSDYWVIADARTMYDEITYIPVGLSKYRDDFDIDVDHIPSTNTVFFHSTDSFKKPADISFKTQQEEYDFEKAYDKYYFKRWDDMPQIEISSSNYEELKQKWDALKSEKPQYVIFTLDDSGPLDKVDVFGKNELSQQDLQEMKIEHEKSLKHTQAIDKYMQNHPDYSAVWRSPTDDEYEADIMKYFDDTN